MRAAQLPFKKLLLIVAIIGSARAFRRDHARTDRILRRAYFTEERAFVWRHDATKHISTAAALWILRGLHFGMEALDRIESFELFADRITRTRDHAQPAPAGMAAA